MSKIGKQGWIILAGVWLVFAVNGAMILDADFGWHLRMGEVIVKTGIPSTDLFSYTMPGYPFVDYEWGTEVLWYKLFPLLGMTGLAAIYALIAVGAVLIAVSPREGKMGWAAALLTWSVMLSRFGVRVQVVSWLLLAILVRWLWDETVWKKWRKWYPVLMLVWVNLHGSFPLGISIAGMWLVIKTVTERKGDIKSWFWWGSGIIATFINPYGIRDWAEVIKQMASTGINRGTIAEWAPFYDKLDLGLWALVAMAVVGWYAVKKVNFARMSVVVGLWLAALWNLRHGPLGAIALAVAAADSWALLKVKVGKNRIAGNRWKGFEKLLLIVSGVIFVGEAVITLTRAVDYERRNFPVGAVEYLKKNGYPGNAFNKYGWGGYLEWKMPDKKWFIDGRMSNWVTDDSLLGESNWAFKEYLQVLRGEMPVEEVWNKYGIRTVILESRKGFSETKFLLKWTRQEGGPEEGFDLVKELLSRGWTKVYEDNMAVVVEKI